MSDIGEAEIDSTKTNQGSRLVKRISEDHVLALSLRLSVACISASSAETPDVSSALNNADEFALDLFAEQPAALGTRDTSDPNKTLADQALRVRET